jgi:hypothetical protein
MNSIRQFNDNDFAAFAGVSSFADDTRPLIWFDTTGDIVVVGSKIGISILFSPGESEDFIEAHLTMNLPSQPIARATMAGVIASIDFVDFHKMLDGLSKLGFKAI